MALAAEHTGSSVRVSLNSWFAGAKLAALAFRSACAPTLAIVRPLVGRRAIAGAKPTASR
jgi:hypothetical protein